uniref:Uncharacterized protein n=1 Tax=Oryza nivara TaxID=4536 RepID=A0A0E0J3M4_ORYNI
MPAAGLGVSPEPRRRETKRYTQRERERDDIARWPPRLLTARAAYSAAAPSPWRTLLAATIKFIIIRTNKINKEYTTGV